MDKERDEERNQEQNQEQNQEGATRMRRIGQNPRERGATHVLAALCAALALGAALFATGALAEEYDAEQAQAWLERFAAALSGMETLNDPAETIDPARGGQALLEYAFGTVSATRMDGLAADDLIEINVTGGQVTDCRGVCVGMPLESALGGAQVEPGVTQLSVLGTQQSGIGWGWAYVGETGVYGVEYVSYGQAGDGLMREYTLTYVIGEEGTITAINMRMAQATQAQAEDALRTALEIAGRQQGEVLAPASGASAFGEADMQVMGAVLGTAVDRWVAKLGEPVEIQTLPGNGGRMLLYEGAVLKLGFNEQTGEEIVFSASVSGSDISGPRGLCVGMSVQEAAMLFACEQDVYASGGVLYLQGEALGEPPYGELLRGEDGAVLRYVAQTAAGHTVVLEAGIRGGDVAYWQLTDRSGEAETAYGG